MNKVAIISGALRCSPGDERDTVSAALLKAHSAPSYIQSDVLPQTELPYFPMQGSLHTAENERLFETLAACAAEALEGAGLSTDQRQQTGLFLGSSSFAIGAAEQQYRQALATDPDALALPHQRYGDFARQLSHRFDLRAEEYTFSTACTSSANALLYAAQAIRSGKIPSALVVGVEGFNHTTLLGFNSLQLISRNGYRPFDRRRDGLILGEGIAAVVLTARDTHAAAPGWEGVSFLGGANGCDPTGITCSTAESMARVMHLALEQASTSAAQVALIKAHATASVSNDAAEAAAMQLVFDAGQTPPLTSLKGSLGHTLGASGVLELVALTGCLKAGFMPPTSGFSAVDPALDCLPLTRATPFPGGTVMCNYFGFGGNNTSFIMEFS